MNTEGKEALIRKAQPGDIPGVTSIYEHIHDEEEAGRVVIGWNRKIYPTEHTALEAFYKEELFVLEDHGCIVATAKINQEQVPEYANVSWEYDAPDEEIMVLHTLVVDPFKARKGYGKQFIEFYEQYALENECKYLRIDTNERNARARQMYAKLGYKEVGIVDCTFNGIEGVHLVCLEKYLG